jgi:N-carbamoyl-L-amino-acid hydrolase
MLHMSDDTASNNSHHDELLNLLQALGRIGETESGGIARLAASPADGEARNFLCAWLKRHDFTVLIDAVGNIYGVLDLERGDPEKHFFCGSHLDSQPEAGKFDGALGVVCACIGALCIQEKVKRNQLAPEFRYFVVCCWTGEEGARFQPSLIGSSVFAGARSAEETLAITDGDGISLATALDAIGYRGSDTIPRADQYLEVHIEQSTMLERARFPVALVTSCWGARKIRLVVKGVPDHTGPTPMEERRNALLAASHLIIRVEQLATRSVTTLYSSVGRIEVQPNSPNTIADHVTLWIEFRSPDETTLEQAETDLLVALGEIEQQTGCSATVSSREIRNVVGFDQAAMTMIGRAFETHSIPYLQLTTIAGHDAVRLQAVCPSTLLFVPSRDGITHSPEEYTSDDDVCAGFDAMLVALQCLLTGPEAEHKSRSASQ